jgi:4-hydroxybenzoyl-CoA thioesterase
MRAIASRQEGEAMSRTVTTTIRVEWGDCDPAGIVYYPRFFHWCDVATWNFFAASGLPLIELQKRYGIIGFPLLEASATFRVPSRPQDPIAIATRLGTLRRKTLELRHAFSRDGVALLEAREVRVWAHHDATRPNGLRAAAIPPEVVARLTASSEDAAPP